MGFWKRFKRAAEAFRQEEEKVVVISEEKSEEVVKTQKRWKRNGRPPDPQSNRGRVFNAIKENFLEKSCSIADIAFVLEPPLSKSQIGDILLELCNRNLLTHEGKNHYRLTKAQAAQGSAYWGESRPPEQEEEPPIAMAEGEEEAIKEGKKKGEVERVRRPDPQSKRAVVFNAIRENFLQKTVSISDVSSVLGTPLTSPQIGRALTDLCNGKWISRVEVGRYILTERQVKQWDKSGDEEIERRKGGLDSPLLPIQRVVPKIFLEMIKSFLSERKWGGRGVQADIIPLLAEQLAKKEGVLQEEIVEVNNILKARSEESMCYIPTPAPMYNTIQGIAKKVGVPIRKVIFCLILRWYKEQKKKTESTPSLCSTGQNEQHNLTVARWLRKEINKDLGEFCKDVGIDPDKYSHWERGETDWDRLSSYELKKLSGRFGVEVLDIATPDGRPVFLHK